MTKDFLKTIYADSWLAECVDYLADEFFDPNKEVRFPGESRYYDLRPFVLTPPKSLVERIMDERAYRDKCMQLIPKNENERIYYEETLQMSREREWKLLKKLENRNSALGDIDKARQYPIDELIQFKHGFTKCLWHNDSSPSLHFIRERNTAHCFSCGRSFDSIDAARQLWGLSFKETIKKLTT